MQIVLMSQPWWPGDVWGLNCNLVPYFTIHSFMTVLCVLLRVFIVAVLMFLLCTNCLLFFSFLNVVVHVTMTIILFYSPCSQTFGFQSVLQAAAVKVTIKQINSTQFLLSELKWYSALPRLTEVLKVKADDTWEQKQWKVSTNQIQTFTTKKKN